MNKSLPRSLAGPEPAGPEADPDGALSTRIDEPWASGQRKRYLRSLAPIERADNS
ncbi:MULTISPECIES: hypothetical protein [Synechococcales]|jgi:hypothetical protein|uniref:hypothetical protein n=1 Tax=unclassified Synechococcus TaxID=2626047 RepID=UPI0020CD3D06|nr:MULTISPECIES: hypothetical protein [unclassified Synechococcus]MCP9848020.1 hypothetical protein [Synechococcus sp. Lug-A]MCT0211291.1 hypothetical protein [Synechococcus sp. CS-1333]